MDRIVCRLISVICSLDIVKRVVTVKQVQPVTGWTWAWVCEDAGARASRRSEGLCLGSRAQVTALRRQSGGSVWTGVLSVLCPLPALPLQLAAARAWG